MKTEKQERHEQLIRLLNKFSQYQSDGIPRLKMRLKPLRTSDLIGLNETEVDYGAIVLTDYLNLPGGSLVDIDLYKLLQAYFLNLKKRKIINKIIRNEELIVTANINYDL